MAAAEIRNTYAQYQETIKYKPTEDVIEKATAEYNARQPKPTTYKTTGFNPCSCVAYIKYLTGFTTSIGLAKYWPVDTHIATVGAVVVFRASYTGHVALVTALNPESFHIKEYNWIRCSYSERNISYNDPTIIGFDE